MTYLVTYKCHICPKDHIFRIKANDIQEALQLALRDPYWAKIRAIRETNAKE